jgi:hypothetical protein
MVRKLVSRLEQTSKRAIAAFGVFLVIFIGVVDFATGLELHLMFFYLLPIALVSWFVDRRTEILIAALCALTWLLANHVGGRRYSSDLIMVWNFSMRAGGFHSDCLLDLATENDSRPGFRRCEPRLSYRLAQRSGFLQSRRA